MLGAYCLTGAVQWSPHAAISQVGCPQCGKHSQWLPHCVTRRGHGRTLPSAIVPYADPRLAGGRGAKAPRAGARLKAGGRLIRKVHGTAPGLSKVLCAMVFLCHSGHAEAALTAQQYHVRWLLEQSLWQQGVMVSLLCKLVGAASLVLLLRSLGQQASGF